MEQGQQCIGSNYHTKQTDQQLGFFVSTTLYSLGVVSLSTAAALESDFARNVDVQFAVEARAELMSLPAEFSKGNDLQEEHATPHHQFLDAIGWPLVNYQFIVFHKHGASREGESSCPTARRMANFLVWMYTNGAVGTVMRTFSFAPLRQEAKEVLLSQLLELTCDGEPLITTEEYLHYAGQSIPTISATAPAAILGEVQRRATPYNHAKVKFDPVNQSDCTSPLSGKELFRMVICEEPPQHEDSAVLPYALHTIVVAVNLPGLTGIKLDFEAIMAIIQRDVTHFNDPMLVALNPELAQVEKPIVHVGSKPNTDVMRTVQRTLLASGISGSDARGDFLWDGCNTADVCHESIIKQRHYMMSQPYTLAFLTGSISELQGSNIILAAIAGMGMESAVEPDPVSILSYIVLHRNYVGPHAGAATEVVKFWDWMLAHGMEGGHEEADEHLEQEVVDLVQLLETDSISQLTRNELMVQLSLFLPDLVHDILASLQVNGETVLAEALPSDDRVSVVIIGVISGTAAAAVLFLAVCGLCMFRRNRLLAAKIVALEQDDRNKLDIDVDSPLVKTLKFLERLSQQSRPAGEAGEAGELFQLLRNADKNAIPTALLKAATGDGESSKQPIMSFLLDLTNAQGTTRLSSRPNSSSASSSLREEDCTAQSLRGRFSSFHRRTSRVSEDETSDLMFKPSNMSEALPPRLLSCLGTSYFCNVMHLKKHRVQHPLAFVTYMTLEMTGLTQSMKLDRAKLKMYLERLDSFYRADNLYHNAWHAADVVQRVAVIMAAINLPMLSFENQITYLAAILGAAVHDADHPGRDNKFMIRNDSELAQRFNDQHVLENHSINLCLEMMREEGTNFLEGSRLNSRKTWLKFKARLINVVLATDMANHFDILSKFKSTFMGSAVDATDEERMQPNMELILQMVIKCADLGHCTMMRKTHLFWSKCLEEEFFLQGDQEKATGTKPSELSPLTDRDQLGAMSPGNQIGFFNYIILPMYNALAATFPGTAPLSRQAEENWMFWKAELEKEAHRGTFGAQSVEAYEKSMLDATDEGSMMDAEL
eukprot:jgi/Tetstr1/437882/TSEL_026521.t1